MYQYNPLLEAKKIDWRKVKDAAKKTKSMKAFSKTEPINIEDFLANSGRKLHWKEATKQGTLLRARQATPEEVEKAGGRFFNRLADGTREVGGEGMPFKVGDWIAQGKRGEEWIPSKFSKKYEQIPGSPGIFRAKGPNIMVTRAPQDLTWAPKNWGGATASVKKGGYIVHPVNDPTDIYPIGKKELKAVGYQFTGRRRNPLITQ